MDLQFVGTMRGTKRESGVNDGVDEIETFNFCWSAVNAHEERGGWKRAAKLVGILGEEDDTRCSEYLKYTHGIITHLHNGGSANTPN